MKDFFVRPAALSAVGLCLVLGACASKQSEDRAAVEIRGTDPSGATATAALPPPESVNEPLPETVVPGAAVAAGTPGVVDYGDYRVAVAEDGDTVASLAGRIGMSAAELGSYNGLQPSSPLRQGDELVLPDNVTIQVAAAPPASQPVGARPDSDPVDSMPLGGETEVAALPSDDGASWSPARAAAAIERSNDPESAPVPQTAPATTQTAALPQPPSAADPVPAAPPEPADIVPADLGQYQGNSKFATPFQLTRPVEGTVAIPFNLAGGPERNEGVDFAATPGTPVVAAEDGEVALVSESLGGLGTIVLIRHPDDILTVYGRLSGVTVQKGDYLERGQRFGEVADPPAGTQPRMHFEVRKGAESIDPMSML